MKTANMSSLTSKHSAQETSSFPLSITLLNFSSQIDNLLVIITTNLEKRATKQVSMLLFLKQKETILQNSV